MLRKRLLFCWVSLFIFGRSSNITALENDAYTSKIVYIDLRSFGKLHNSNDSNTHLLGGCVVINQKECHSWCSNHVQTANYFNTLTVEMLNLFYYPKFKSSVPKSLCYIKMYSQLNFRSVIYSYLFSMSAVVSIQVKINVFWILKVKVPFYKFIIIAFFLYDCTWNFLKTCYSKWSKK